jgi:hypothetical protein
MPRSGCPSPAETIWPAPKLSISRPATPLFFASAVGAGEDYGASQRFAAGALGAGFDGIRYLVRHDPSQKLYGIALFGAPRGADPGDKRWLHQSGPFPAELLARAEHEFGYRVLPTP